VRRIAGVLVKTGLGEIATEDVLRLLDGKIDPRLDIAAWTAPSSGLFLESVSYGEASKQRPAQRRMGYTRRTNL
jgi:tRNA U38,U39,U40 pseudouridine synthase TruA